MGVLDRIRRRPSSHAPASPESGPVAQAADAVTDSAPQMRGDFMLLPPLRPTFGSPARFQHSLDDFLVTHRPTAVTSEPLAHEIEPERMGVVRASARRTRRPRPAPEALVHRHDVDESEFDVLAEQLPPPPAPRRLSATKTASVSRVPAAEFPSASLVRKSVSAPSIRMRTAEPEDSDADLSAVIEASRSESSTDAPVMRRRGGAALPETASPIPPTGPTLMEDLEGLDLDSLEAPRAADIPPLSGGTRVRGAQPPAPSAATRPLIGSSTEPTTTPVDAELAAPAPELVHRTEDAASTGAGTATPAAAAADGSSVESPEISAATSPVIPAPNMSGARESRSLLGERPSIATPPSAASAKAATSPRPGSAGRTGVQRKARNSAAPVQHATPSARPAQESAFTDSAAGTHADPASGSSGSSQSSARATVNTAATETAVPLEARGTVPPSLAPGNTPAPRNVDVPPEVRTAVAAATGSAPDSVKVHQGDHVHAETEALNAEAFTRDGEIYLAADANLDTPRGKALLAHELTHVAQQRGGTEHMPDESTREGVAHEQAALKVERAIASSSPTPALGALDHSRAAEPSGAAPANVPEGVQRRGREINPSINDSDDDSDDEGIGLPHQPEPAIAHASALKPSLLEQVDLVHAGHPTPVREEEPEMPGAGLARRGAMRAGSAGTGAQSISVSRAGGGSTSGSSAPSAGSPEMSGSGEGASGAGSYADSTGESPRPEPSTKEKAFDYFSRMMLPPEAAKDRDSASERRGELERQADSLYPLLRSRLRAELVRDRERRGRLAREWR